MLRIARVELHIDSFGTPILVYGGRECTATDEGFTDIVFRDKHEAMSYSMETGSFFVVWECFTGFFGMILEFWK